MSNDKNTNESAEGVREVSRAVNYRAGDVPAAYVCAKCEARGVKLWREYNTFANHTSLLCGPCSVVEQGKLSVIERPDGGLLVDGERGDQIGWRVPAVPALDDMSEFWGYSSVPDDGCAWFKRLPLATAARPGR